MEIKIALFLLLGIVFYFYIILYLLVKRKLNLSYTLIWLLSAISMFLLVLFPQPVMWVAEFLGIQAPINLVFTVEGLFVILILLSITAIVSMLSNRIYRLTQTLALQEARLRKLEESRQKVPE